MQQKTPPAQIWTATNFVKSLIRSLRKMLLPGVGSQQQQECRVAVLTVTVAVMKAAAIRQAERIHQSFRVM